MRALLDRLDPSPVIFRNQLSEVLAFTSGCEWLARPIGLLDAQPPSLARFVFTDARARAAYPEWHRIADEQVANLRTAPGSADPHIAELAKELTITAGGSFTDRWEVPPVLPNAPASNG